MEGDSSIFEKELPHIKRGQYLSSIFDFDKYGYHLDTTLHVAARNGHWLYLSQLLEHESAKKSINALNSHGYSPLMLAATNGLTKCLTVLLDKRGFD